MCHIWPRSLSTTIISKLGIPTFLPSFNRIYLATSELALPAALSAGRAVSARAIAWGVATLLAGLDWINLALGELCSYVSGYAWAKWQACIMRLAVLTYVQCLHVDLADHPCGDRRSLRRIGSTGVLIKEARRPASRSLYWDNIPVGL